MRVDPCDDLSVLKLLAIICVLGAILTPLAANAEECASNWTNRLILTDNEFHGSGSNGTNMFIIVGYTGTNLRSTDGGVTWTAGNTMRDAWNRNGPYWAITYGQSKWVASGWRACIQTSTNGISWTYRDSGLHPADDPETPENESMNGPNLNGITYDPGRDQFAAVGEYGAVTISPDGTNWTPNDQSDSYQFTDICVANNGRYVAACGEGRVAKSDNGGQTWSLQQVGDNSGPEGSEHFYAAAYGNVGGTHTVVVVGRTGVIYTSSDNGVNWTKMGPSEGVLDGLANIYEITFTGTHFAAVSAREGTVPLLSYCPILTSPDGFDWTTRDSDAACSYLLTITYLDGMNKLVGGGQRANFVTADCPFEPFATEHPASASPCENGPVEFCVTVAGEWPFTYQWARDTGGGWGDIGGAQSDCYSIGAVSTTDTGEYRCRVWNSYGTITSNPGTLTVRVAPKTFSEQPATQDVCEFESVQLCVTADGSPVLSYQWERDVGGGWVNAPTGYLPCLTINSVDPDADDGDYRCRVWNECGTLTSNEFTLTVIERAKADFDCDLDVDQDDFGHFQACLTGSGEPQTNLACVDAKLDGDTDVDADDFAKFLNCLSGPDITAVVSCAD